MHCSLEDFCEGRVGVDDALELGQGCFSRDESTGLLNYVRCVRTIKVTSENSAWFYCRIWLRGSIRLSFCLRFGGNYDLAESVGLPHGHCLAVGTEE